MNKISQQRIYVVEDVSGAKKVFQFFNTLSLCLNYWPNGLHGGAWSRLNDFNEYLTRENITDPETVYFVNNILGVSIYRHLIRIDKGLNPAKGKPRFALIIQNYRLR